MRHFAPILAAVSALSFTAAACGTRNETVPAEPVATEIAPPPAAVTPAPQPSATATAAVTPPSESRDPTVVLEFWRHALETHDYATARGVWGDHGAASGQTPAEFAAAWDKYRIIDITVGKGEGDAGAGSLFYEAPVTVTGLKRDGAPYNLSGSVTIRRVNDVDGATPEQLRWHIERSTLLP